MDKAKVLLAEDDVVVAADLAIEMEAAGLVVAATICSLAGVLKLIEETPPDIVILNVALRDGASFPAARRLRALNIPFVFLTSFKKSEIDPEFQDVPLLEKPQRPGDVAAFVAGLAETRMQTPDRGDGRSEPAPR
ncbi:MAG: hypothetical protein RID23_03640 [Roseovarius sp.]